MSPSPPTRRHAVSLLPTQIKGQGDLRRRRFLSIVADSPMPSYPGDSPILADSRVLGSSSRAGIFAGMNRRIVD